MRRACGCDICVSQCVQRSEDNYVESVLSLHLYVGSRIKLGSSGCHLNGHAVSMSVDASLSHAGSMPMDASLSHAVSMSMDASLSHAVSMSMDASLFQTLQHSTDSCISGQAGKN